MVIGIFCIVSGNGMVQSNNPVRNPLVNDDDDDDYPQENEEYVKATDELPLEQSKAKKPRTRHTYRDYYNQGEKE